MTDSELAILRRHVDEVAADGRRHLETLVEHTDSQIQLVLEAYAGQSEKLDRVAAEVATHTRQLEVVRTQVQALTVQVTELQAGQAELQAGQVELRQELTDFRAEVAHEFKEVRAQIRLSYDELDGRLRSLEHEVVSLRARVERIESLLPA